MRGSSDAGLSWVSPECVKSCRFLVGQKSHMRTHPRDESGVTFKMMSLLMMIMMTIMMMMVQASYMKYKGAAPCGRLILPPNFRDLVRAKTCDHCNKFIS